MEKKFQLNLKEIAQKHNIKINISGIPSLTTYSFSSRNTLKYKTYITQEMLKNGFLASTHFYSCIKHTDKFLTKYFNVLDSIFNTISKCEKDELNIDKLLDGPVCHSGFKRLN